MTFCVVYVIHTRHLLMYRELKVDFNVLTREKETEQAKYFEVFEMLRVYPRDTCHLTDFFQTFTVYEG